MIPSFVSESSEKVWSQYWFVLLLPQPLGLDMALYLLANVELPQGQERIIGLAKAYPAELCDIIRSSDAEVLRLCIWDFDIA